MKPLLSLVMPILNEALSLREVLTAVKPHIDRWTIIDTGSTDGSQEIVEDVLKDVPGLLVHDRIVSVAETRKWEEPGFELLVDFAALRNLALAHDRAADHPGGPPAEFQLILSGDEYLRAGAALRQDLETHRTGDVDCFFLRVSVDTDEIAALQPRVVRTGSAWQYEDPLHENLVNRAANNLCALCDRPLGEHVRLAGTDGRDDVIVCGVGGPESPPQFTPSQAKVAGIPDARIDHLVADPMRRLEAVWNHHVPVLRRWLQDEPNNARALVFLAQSYARWLPGLEPHERIQYAMEAMGLYLRRMAIPGGLAIERNNALLGFLNLARQVGVFTAREIYDRYEGLFQADPRRADVALQCAEAAKSALPLPKVYECYRRAAVVAQEATMDDSVPASTAVGWQAHYMAAVAARQLAGKFPDEVLAVVDTHNVTTSWETRVREHITQGLGAGGTWEVFKKVATLEVRAAEGAPADAAESSS